MSHLTVSPQDRKTVRGTQRAAVSAPQGPAAERENPHSPVRRLVEGLFRAKGMVIVFTGLGAAIGAGVGLLKPNEYISTAKFLFRSGSEQVAVSPAADLPRDFGAREGVAENAPHLLVSPDLARRVVDRLGVKKVLQPFKPTADGESSVRDWLYDLQGRIHNRDPQEYTAEEAVATLLGNLGVSSVRRSKLLDVTYTANDPKLAREVLATYVDEAVKFHIDVYREETAVKLVKADHESAEKALTAAQKEHDALLVKMGLTNFDLEYEALQQESIHARRALQTLEEDTIPGLEIRIREATRNLKGMSPTKVEKVPVPVPDQLIALLTTQVMEAETRLLAAQLRVKDENAPEIKSARRLLDSLNARLEAERRAPPKIVMQEKVIENNTYTSIHQRLEDAEVALAVAKEKLAPTRRRAETLSARVASLAALANDYVKSRQKLQRCTDELRAAAVRLARTENLEHLESNHLSTLKLVAGPELWLNRIGPKRGQMAILGLFAGLGLAGAIVAMRALTESTVRSPEELEEMLGVRVLATVPELSRKHVRRHENRVTSG